MRPHRTGEAAVESKTSSTRTCRRTSKWFWSLRRLATLSTATRLALCISSPGRPVAGAVSGRTWSPTRRSPAIGFAEVTHVPDEVCKGCNGSNPVGYIHCFQCDTLQERMSCEAGSPRNHERHREEGRAQKQGVRDLVITSLINDPFYT